MLQALWSVLALLICPLMMILMMKGMHGGHDAHGSHGQPRKKFRSKEEELEDLWVQLESLQTQYNRLAEEVNADSTSKLQSDRYKEVHF
ncbi:DUF2933 domain-containing protein [Alicyclobacillus curvatus]|nr:DUF2933 domain-containing protein [Alicyclobacillus curvatus]